MLLDAAKSIAFLLCLITLYFLFFIALMQSGNPKYRILESLELLALAAGIAWVSGLIFRESIAQTSAVKVRLTSTLPVQVFLWASSIILCLFLLSWYLETYCKFYRDLTY
jgi:hypothetical protein